MISRSHGLVLSLLLGAASATGAYAIIGTAQLGDAQTKPEVVSSRQIAKRAHKLDSWEASLKKALKARPPALAALNHFAAVTFVTGPGAASLPATVAPAPRTVQQAEPATRQVAEVPKPVTAAAKAAHPVDKPKSAVPVAEPEHISSEPAPTPAAVAAATPAPASSLPATLSVEQQCRLLLRAAEGKSEQVKQEAERQCEALKQAGEKGG
jgi:hypothetical protein